METGSFTIGALARATSTKVETIRYYERIGCCRRQLAPAATIGPTRGPILSG